MVKKIKECILALKYPSVTFNPKGNKSKSSYITPKQFEQHLLWLMDWRYNPLTADELYHFLFEGLDIPFKSFVLLFEGGYKNFKQYAYPILKRYKIPAIVFLVVNHIGDCNRWEDGKEEILTVDEIAELNRTTMITFGLETKSHPDLTKLTDEQLEDEIVKAKLLLEEIIRYKVNYFYYPYGKTSDKVIKKLEEAEIPLAFTGKFSQITSLDSFHRIPSIQISQNDNYIRFLSKLRLLEG